jgi:hypothetical protein
LIGKIMLQFIHTLAITLVVIAMVPAMAHAFEFPGKKRLNRDEYVTVQAIYYPGFTLLGISEPAALIATIVLLFNTPQGTMAFWQTLIAVCATACMQVIYWLLIHPTNKYWLQSGSVALGSAGSGFFGVGSASAASGDVEWTRFRDRWEYSHIARAVLAFISFLLLLAAGA